MTRRTPAAIELFLSKDRIARFWFWLCVVTVVGFAIERHRLVKSLTQARQYIVMDANGTYFLPSVLDFEEAKEVHAQQTKLTIESLFNRSPSGPDNPERLKRLLGKKALEKAKRLFKDQDAEFRDKQLHQKVEIGAIQVLQIRDHSVLTAAEGQIIRTGVFEGKTVTEVLKVKAQFKFVLNPDMSRNGRYPTVALAFDVETKIAAEA